LLLELLNLLAQGSARRGLLPQIRLPVSSDPIARLQTMLLGSQKLLLGSNLLLQLADKVLLLLLLLLSLLQGGHLASDRVHEQLLTVVILTGEVVIRLHVRLDRIRDVLLLVVGRRRNVARVSVTRIADVAGWIGLIRRVAVITASSPKRSAPPKRPGGGRGKHQQPRSEQAAPRLHQQPHTDTSFHALIVNIVHRGEASVIGKIFHFW
jgi:hypothetical protein